MKPTTITIPLAVLPPECATPGHKLELNAVAQIESVEGDQAQVRLSAINSHALDDSATETPEPDEAAMRRLAQADDDAQWQD